MLKTLFKYLVYGFVGVMCVNAMLLIPLCLMTTA
jgi:hypothetical protein